MQHQYVARMKQREIRDCLQQPFPKNKGVRAEWCLLKQFHKYTKYNWPRQHTEKHGKINCLSGNGCVSLRVFPWQGS